MISVLVDTGGYSVDEPALVRAVTRALEARGIDDAEVSLALLSDTAMRQLNREHLGHDRPTDVIAFALWGPGDAQVVGDVYVGVDQARRQAETEAVPIAEELVRLAVHGTLHVSGMDHPDDATQRAASAMYRLQEALVDTMRAEGAA